ncbi:polysaccharide biosynthesis/export family protein [uncultured Mucilaginibacter sp.]|uniref:polysaccharide biosynthesis/export family protein n=1 Tax=uncultured Mucilaginibacter sp. TaxID=797541 RepID=UPI0025F49533|nr:polysaccharide biosynthesis/export family protein [uncultured Mucilaginibacter sp.]
METKTSTKKLQTIKSLVILFAVTAILSSCGSYKKVPYFQDLDRSQVTSEAITNMSSLTIQPEDQISISVTSLNQDAANVFTNNGNLAGTDSQNPVYGYTVDSKGEVTLPLLGVVKVSGKTSEELSKQLQQQLTSFLSKPNVSVKIVNFKVAVLGDVARPNIYRSSTDRLTITEALSLAGDLNITAKRDDITLVREIDGKRTYIPIDLTSKNLFQSPYFYMKSNDLLFVQPGKLKLATVDTGYRNASLIISALTLVAIAISLFTN